jgi:hypothetical protein
MNDTRLRNPIMTLPQLQVTRVLLRLYWSRDIHRQITQDGASNPSATVEAVMKMTDNSRHLMMAVDLSIAACIFQNKPSAYVILAPVSYAELLNTVSHEVTADGMTHLGPGAIGRLGMPIEAVRPQLIKAVKDAGFIEEDNILSQDLNVPPKSGTILN